MTSIQVTAVTTMLAVTAMARAVCSGVKMNNIASNRIAPVSTTNELTFRNAAESDQNAGSDETSPGSIPALPPCAINSAFRPLLMSSPMVRSHFIRTAAAAGARVR